MGDDITDWQPEGRIRLDNYVVASAPRLGVRGWLRWIWRQVTSMRVALILLLFLGLASIPGSVLPQWPQDPVATRSFIDSNPWWGALLERLGMLDVFGSAWFTAIYVLLFASLIGCIVPRAIVYAKALRTPLSPAPRTLDRFDPTQVEVDDAAVAIDRARQWLRPKEAWWGAASGYRVRVDHRDGSAGPEIALSADKGHVREWGNLVFHLALVAILVCVALGAALTYRGQTLIVEGRTFTNALVAYDSFESGRLFSPEDLVPFTLRLDRLESEFRVDGTPTRFTAWVTLEEPGQSPRELDIEVNRPLQVHGGKIYLQGNGYAPDLTVVDADGNVALSGPVPFLPQDAAYTSEGVVKVPDVTSGPQIGLKATLLPTAIIDGDTAFSVHPQPANPVIFFRIYTGDLGLDTGRPQNVYQLDESQLSPVHDANGEVMYIAMAPGDSVELPDGLGTVTWNSLPRFAALDLRTDPTLPWLLVSSIVCLVALGMSLMGSRRRIWVVATTVGGTTVVTSAVLAPSHDWRAAQQVREWTVTLSQEEKP